MTILIELHVDAIGAGIHAAIWLTFWGEPRSALIKAPDVDEAYILTALHYVAGDVIARFATGDAG